MDHGYTVLSLKFMNNLNHFYYISILTVVNTLYIKCYILFPLNIASKAYLHYYDLHNHNGYIIVNKL